MLYSWASVFMGVRRMTNLDIRLSLSFPSGWNKVSTGLEDISEKRSDFIYGAKKL